VYFDVFLLLAAAVLAETVTDLVSRVPSLTQTWTATAAATAVLVAGSAAVMLPLSPLVDAGAAGARPFLRSGFTGDEREGDRTFAWVDGRHASILLLRRTARVAAIDVFCSPALAAQQMSAVLNGALVGTVTLARGWNEVSLTPPAQAPTFSL